MFSKMIRICTLALLFLGNTVATSAYAQTPDAGTPAESPALTPAPAPAPEAETATPVVVTPPPVVAVVTDKPSGSDWVDTRLSFVFADDNVFAGAGETNPNSPAARLGANNQNTLFFDNVNTRFSGFETLSNLVLYKKLPSFFAGLTTEAALHVQLLEQPSGGVTLRDSSSYVRLAYRPASWGDKEDISLTGFPVSADRFRLGYVYRLTWGGSDIFTNRAAANGVPGVKLQVTKERWYAYAGAKTALVLNDLIKEQETLYGFMGGAGTDLLKNRLRLELGAGYFQKGIVPGLAVNGVRAPVNSWGASGRLAYFEGEPVGASVDLRLYRNDPNVYETLFRPESYPGGVTYLVSVEGNFLQQTLEDPEVFGATVKQAASGAALVARVKIDYARIHLTGLYRSLSFIQFNVPGTPPFSDFPDGTELTPEVWLALGADYHFPSAHFTPGIIIGVQQPAAFTSPETGLGGNTPPASLQGRRTVVVRDVNQFSILPSGFDAEPIISAKSTFRWDLSQIISAIGEVYFTRDPNRTTFRDDVEGIAQPTFDEQNALGFNAIIQARF